MKTYVVTDGHKCYFKQWDEVNAVIVLDDMIGWETQIKYYTSKEEALEVANQRPC